MVMVVAEVAVVVLKAPAARPHSDTCLADCSYLLSD